MAVTSGDSAEDHAAPSSSSRKMKFLCSFGGKILPRPSDGALRYVGGHTRIISLRRDSSFEELRAKLSDVFGGTAVFKYQLPDEDLDALVTVSSAEDLENMMEEYDKLAEISPDGSAKLRVFLFSPSEIEYPGLTVELDAADPEYRYMDAVNAVGELGLSDFSSVRTSNELVDCNFGVVSASNLSPVSSEGGKGVVTAAQDPFELVGPPVDEQSYISVSLDYLESLQLGSRGVEDLEQRGRIEYLNSRLRGDPIQQFSSPLEIESGSDQFLDVFASQKSENINQTSLSIDPEAPFSYFDNIMRQHPPPVGPPQFLLKQDLINDPLGIPFIPGQHSEVNLLPSENSMVNDPWNLLAKPDIISPSKSVDHGTEVGLETAISPIPKSQRGDQALMGQSTKSQRSNADLLMDMNPSKVNTQKASPSTHYDDKTQRNSSSEEHVLNEEGKSGHTEKAAQGFAVLEDHGVRLQIIKNSDLEELRELGTGAFGTVYHGKWRGTDVAIKRINDRCFAGKPSEQERLRVDFWNEACKLADLHHPNVVAFYGVVIDGPGGSMATVTEFMVNGSLWQALRENDKSLDQRKRRLIAMDVAFGMEYLHGKNIVHFDLKSDNLLVNLGDPNRPICKVGDLGLSKVKRQTLISGGIIGTLPWMAPELLNGRSTLVSEKVDVFSFGIVMWELLTGEEPYADLHHGAIIGGIVSDTLRPTIPELCDEEWRALMVACWSTDPADRPSFTEIAAKLRAMAQRSQNSFVPIPRENS